MTVTYFIDLFFRKTLVPLNRLRIKTNPLEADLIKELKMRASSTAIPNKISSVHDQWLGNIIRLKQQILSDNPKNFLQWDLIRKTMFIGNALFTLREFIYLRYHNWNKWKKAVVEKNFLFTEPYLLYPKSSGNLIHYAYHIARFEDISGKKIKDFDFIFEFGGGYGGMCLLIQNLMFNGKYIIYDFPILSALQGFFLKMNEVENNTFCLDNIDKVKKTIPKKGKKLFIATWSLSESPLQIRKIINPLIKDFDAFIIGYQRQFGGVDNHKYFKNYQKSLGKLKWWSQEIVHLKGNFYIFGF